MKHMLSTLFSMAGICLSVATMINAYGLTVVSWPWLIFGTLGCYGCIAIAAVIAEG